MYNRYVPQGDGSFRRSHVPDAASRSKQAGQPAQPRPPSQPSCPPQTKRAESCPPSKPPQQKPCPPPSRESCKESGSGSIGGFLKGLLPKNFDTGDLLIVLLLLLMAGDCQEDQNSALLTLVLYLFL